MKVLSTYTDGPHLQFLHGHHIFFHKLLITILSKHPTPKNPTTNLPPTTQTPPALTNPSSKNSSPPIAAVSGCHATNTAPMHRNASRKARKNCTHPPHLRPRTHTQARKCTGANDRGALRPFACTGHRCSGALATRTSLGVYVAPMCNSFCAFEGNREALEEFSLSTGVASVECCCGLRLCGECPDFV